MCPLGPLGMKKFVDYVLVTYVSKESIYHLLYELQYHSQFVKEKKTTVLNLSIHILTDNYTFITY